MEEQTRIKRPGDRRNINRMTVWIGMFLVGLILIPVAALMLICSGIWGIVKSVCRRTAEI